MALAFNSAGNLERERKKCRRREIQDHGIFQEQRNT
jgi:hypothetical protein